MTNSNFRRLAVLPLLSIGSFSPILADALPVKCSQIKDHVILKLDVGAYDEQYNRIRISKKDVSTKYVIGSPEEVIDAVDNGYETNICFYENQDKDSEVLIQSIHETSTEADMIVFTVGVGYDLGYDYSGYGVSTKVAFFVEDTGAYVTPYVRLMYTDNAQGDKVTTLTSTTVSAVSGLEYGVQFTKYMGWFVNTGIGYINEKKEFIQKPPSSDKTYRHTDSRDSFLIELTTGIHGQIWDGFGYEVELLGFGSEPVGKTIVYGGLSYRFK